MSRAGGIPTSATVGNASLRPSDAQSKTARAGAPFGPDQDTAVLRAIDANVRAGDSGDWTRRSMTKALPALAPGVARSK